MRAETGWAGTIDTDEAARIGLEIRNSVEADWLAADDPTIVAYLSSLGSNTPREAGGDAV